MEQCQVCSKDGQDRRTLSVTCLYELSEVSDKLVRGEDGYYRLRICKSCRADFMGMLGSWIQGEKLIHSDDDEEACIPVRKLGATVMMTHSQYEAYIKEVT